MPPPPPVARVSVLGAGLIGGSIAAALGQHSTDLDVIVVDPRASARRTIQRRFEIEGATPAAWRRRGPVGRDEAVVLAMPPDVVADFLRDRDRVADVSNAAVVLDTASVKAPICAAATNLGCFVGGHPMAGRERGGADAATGELFVGRPFALCPLPATRRRAVSIARWIVRAIGARSIFVDPAVHDAMVAHTSHVPHVIAWALLDALAHAVPHAVARPSRLLAGGALRDATRVAAADPRLWEQILVANREELACALDGVIARLVRLRDAARADAPLVVPRRDAPPVLDGASLASLRRRLGRFLDAPPGGSC